MKILIVYYSMYGHVLKLARAAAEGALTVAGAEVVLRRVQELDSNLSKLQGSKHAQAVLAQPETERLLKALFKVSSQIPMVLEISTGLIRLRVGRLDLLGFDEPMLRRWLQTLGELGRQVGSLNPLKSEFDDQELVAVRTKMRWIGILGVLFAVALSVALLFILLVYLK